LAMPLQLEVRGGGSCCARLSDDALNFLLVMSIDGLSNCGRHEGRPRLGQLRDTSGSVHQVHLYGSNSWYPRQIRTPRIQVARDRVAVKYEPILIHFDRDRDLPTELECQINIHPCHENRALSPQSVIKALLRQERPVHD
jgi:hypothetical protein